MAATVSTSVRVEIDGPAAVVTLDRPEKRNALSLALMEELIAALGRASETPGVRAIVLAGAGAAFSAGHDLSEMVGRDRAFYDRLFDVCTELMETIHKEPPRAIDPNRVRELLGPERFQTEQLTRIEQPGAALGLAWTPAGGEVLMIEATVMPGSKQLLLTGEPIDAATAAEWGLVNRVVPAERLDAAVQELVEAVARSSPLTVGIGKEAFYAQVELDEHGAYGLTKDVMATNSLAADAQEGICAFLEKRPPTWTGR